MSLENYQGWFSKRDKFFVIAQLEEKDEEFGNKGTQKPYKYLNQPNFDVDLIVGVKIFRVVNWHALIRIYTAFQNLDFKFYRQIVNDPENDIADGKPDHRVINYGDKVPDAAAAWLGHLLQVKG